MCVLLIWALLNEMCNVMYSNVNMFQQINFFWLFDFLSGQATSSLRSLQLLPHSQLVHNPDPQSTQQKEMQQGCWPIWHHMRCWKLLAKKELSWRDNWQRLFSVVVWCHERRASFWTSIRARVKFLDRGSYRCLELTVQIMKPLLHLWDGEHG